jgi:hypothetical protein
MFPGSPCDLKRIHKKAKEGLLEKDAGFEEIPFHFVIHVKNRTSM